MIFQWFKCHIFPIEFKGFFSEINALTRRFYKMKNLTKEKYITADGSPTLYMPSLNEYYHSHHGAIQEANHVYLRHGLVYQQEISPSQTAITVFEVGFGTGLNALLTAQKAHKMKKKIHYLSLEAYPLSEEDSLSDLFSDVLDGSQKEIFQKIHQAQWGKVQEITPWFTLEKKAQRLQDYLPVQSMDVIYYDAFGARAQPEMWTDDCFEKLIPSLQPGGVFVTYAAKGSVRRVLTRLGLEVTLVDGPPGKREMIRAFRAKL